MNRKTKLHPHFLQEDDFVSNSEVQNKVACKKNDECHGKMIFQEQSTEENVTSQFKLYCKKSYLRNTIQTVTVAFTILGAFISYYFGCCKRNKKNLLQFYLFVFSLSVLIYSFTFFEVQFDLQSNEIEQNKNIITSRTQDQEGTNLINHLIEGQLYLFLIFFFLSFFSLGGIIVLIFSYLKDFFSKELLAEVQNNTFLAFALSELIGALLKLIIYDWRKVNMFVIAIPLFFVAVTSLVILKQSPSDMLNRYIDLSNSQNSKISDEEQINSLQEEIYLIFKTICDTNQRSFFSRNQFIILLKRYRECYTKNNLSIQLMTQIAVYYIMFVIGILYFGPLFVVEQVGSGISFNMFSYGLSEILALLTSTKFLSSQNIPNGIKMNLILTGIIGFTITFPSFTDDCHNSFCATKIIQLMIICQQRYFVIIIIFKMLKYINQHDEGVKLLYRVFVFFLLGGSLSPIFGKLNLQLDQIFILIGLLSISASWLASALK